MANDHIVAVHVETSNADPFTGKISSVTFGIPQRQPIKVSLADLKNNAGLQKTLSGPAVKVFNDAKTGLKFLQRNGVEVQGNLFDVDIANRLLTAGLPGEKRTLDGLARENGVAMDTPAKTLISLYSKLRERLAAERLEEVAALEFATISAVVQMEMTGMLLDRGKWEKTKAPGVPDYLRHVHWLTGRIHAGYDQLGADTGRFTCKEPNVHGIPRRVRNCFVASPGHKLIKADYSQEEVRIAAEITKDKSLIADIGNGLDLHCHFASVVLNKPLADVTDKERQTAKAMVFSLLYGSGVTGLWDSLLEKGIVLSQEQVQQLRGQFFRRYAGVAEWYGSMRRAKVTEMRTLSGRRRLWPEYASFPEACNTPIQGTGADILKKALSILPDALHEVGGKVLACVHDDILLEVANDKAEQAERILVGTMNTAWGHYIKRVPIAVESKILDCWE